MIPCIIAPDTARAEPTKIAAISLGSLISLIINILSVTCLVKSAFDSSSSEISAAPKTIEAVNIPIKIKSAVISLRAKFIFCSFSTILASLSYL